MLPNGETERDPATTTSTPIFHVGAREVDERYVGVAVNVNFELRDGAKSRGHAISLHEVPLMRRLYEAGTITLIPSWVPAIPRLRPLNRGQLEAELERLRGSYILPREGGKADLMAEVYGPSQADQLRNLRAAMIKLKDAWMALERKAKERAHAAGVQPSHPLVWPEIVGQYIQPDELEAIVKLIEPTPDSLDMIEIDPIDTAPLPVPDMDESDPQQEDDDLSPVLRLSQSMEEAGLDRRTADEVAMLAVELGSVDRAMLVELEGWPRTKAGEPNVKILKAVERLLRDAGFGEVGGAEPEVD